MLLIIPAADCAALLIVKHVMETPNQVNGSMLLNFTCGYFNMKAA